MPTVQIRGGPSELRQTVTLRERMDNAGVPGLSVAVMVDGKLWAEGFGVADVKTGTPVTSDTLFQAASISKPVASIGALRLVQDGAMTLDGDIHDALTSWTIPSSDAIPTTDPDAPRVTLRRLLSHTAGVNVHGFRGYDRGGPIPTSIGVLDGKGNSDPVIVATVPGAEHRYSGGGYTIAQVAMVDASSFGDFPTLMSSLVLEPLGMQRSTFRQVLPSDLQVHAATGYLSDKSEVAGRSRAHPEMAAAGLWTTPTDLAKCFVSLQPGLDGIDGPVLTADSVEQMFKYEGPIRYGLGLSIGSERYGHGGGNMGFKCVANFFKDDASGVVIMSNSDKGWNVNADVLRTVFSNLGWSGLEPLEKTVIEIGRGQLKRCTGSYEIAGYGTVKMRANDAFDGLNCTLPDGTEFRLFPESESRFFDPDDGVPIDFNLDAPGPASTFKWSGSIATRVP
ncbi:MAG: serine hydrolase [Planctomycetota bacterium]